MAAIFQSDGNSSAVIKDVITCIICKCNNNSPLIQLNCFHVCHQNCLDGSLPFAHPISNFNCTECHTATPIPPQGLPNEILHCKMKEIATVFSNSSPLCKVCEEKDKEKESISFCINCKMHFCSDDEKNHHIFLPQHIVKKNEEIQTEEYLPKLLAPKTALCRSHSTDDSTKPLEFFCLDCNVPACSEGCVKDHKPHTTVSMQDASEKLKEKLKKDAANIHLLRDDGRFVRDQLKIILNEIENNSKREVEKCLKWGEDVKQTIDAIVEKKVREIKSLTQVQRKEIIEITEKNDFDIKHFQSALDYMEVFIKFGTDSDFLQRYEIFRENLNGCLQKNTAIQITTEKSSVEVKNVHIEQYLEGMLKMETVKENHQIERMLVKSSTLEQKIDVGDTFTGVAVDQEDIIAVGGQKDVGEQKIEIFWMNGQRKSQIKCERLGHAWDVEAVNKLIFVSDCDQNKRRVLAINREGKVVKKINLPNQENGLNRLALGLAVDYLNEDLYIASSATDTVYKCPRGQGQAQPFITTGLHRPAYLCVTPNQEVIVSNGSSHSVSKYNSEGRLLWEYGKQGTGEGELNEPKGVCADPWGNIFVCDFNNQRIHHLSPGGKFLSFINNEEKIEYPQTIAFNKKHNKIIIFPASHPYKASVIKFQYQTSKAMENWNWKSLFNLF